jgi:hypothetical protein
LISWLRTLQLVNSYSSFKTLLHLCFSFPGGHFTPPVHPFILLYWYTFLPLASRLWSQEIFVEWMTDWENSCPTEYFRKGLLSHLTKKGIKAQRTRDAHHICNEADLGLRHPESNSSASSTSIVNHGHTAMCMGQAQGALPRKMGWVALESSMGDS